MLEVEGSWQEKADQRQLTFELASNHGSAILKTEQTQLLREKKELVDQENNYLSKK